MNSTSGFTEKIREINLSYLLLAQAMLHQDRVPACFRLGMNEEMADILLSVTVPQLLTLGETSQLILDLRYTPEDIRVLMQDSRVEALQSTHAGILLARNRLKR